MSSPGQVSGATQQAAGQTATAAKDEAAQVASTATTAAADVAGTAKEQAGNVAEEAISQVRDLLDQTKAQVSEQAGGAQDKLGTSLRSLSEELRSMGEGSGSGEGPAAELARNVADKGSAFADYLASKQPGDLVTDLRALAARRPGGFLLGALVAGAAVGRLVRGASAAASDDAQRTASPTTRTRTTPSVPARVPAAVPRGMPVVPAVAEVAPMPTYEPDAVYADPGVHVLPGDDRDLRDDIDPLRSRSERLPGATPTTSGTGL